MRKPLGKKKDDPKTNAETGRFSIPQVVHMIRKNGRAFHRKTTVRDITIEVEGDVSKFSEYDVFRKKHGANNRRKTTVRDIITVEWDRLKSLQLHYFYSCVFT